MRALWIIAVIAGLPVVVLLLIGLSFGAETLSLKWQRYFAPQWEDVRTDTYRQSKSYQEGSWRDLRRLKREYEKEDDAGRAALRTIINQRADELDHSQLPPDLQRFLGDL